MWHREHVSDSSVYLILLFGPSISASRHYILITFSACKICTAAEIIVPNACSAGWNALRLPCHPFYNPPPGSLQKTKQAIGFWDIFWSPFQTTLHAWPLWDKGCENIWNIQISKQIMPYSVLRNELSEWKENCMKTPFWLSIGLIVLYFLFQHGSNLSRIVISKIEVNL